MVGFVTHAACLEHLVLAGHPERPERLAYLLAQLKAGGHLDGLDQVPCAAASLDDAARVHDARLVQWLEASSPDDGLVRVDPDTTMSPGSLGAALACIGAAKAAVDWVLSGEEPARRRAFCAIRPPGHHAEEAAAMGFCLFNTVAVAADLALARADVERLAILDFDVHHGNGTVDIFRDRPEVLVCSTFQFPHYPGRGHDVLRPHLVHSPLRPGSTGSDFRRAVEGDWTPALRAHRPDLILVSAGFDAHEADPLGDLRLSEDDFDWVTRFIVDAAEQNAQGRVVSALEGGYDLPALAASVETHLAALR